MKKCISTVVLLGAVAVSNTQAASCWKGVCTVEAGDTLVQIAKEMDVSWEALMVGNGIKDPTELRVGQMLRMDLAVAAEESMINYENDEEGVPYRETYTVQNGDTLYSIMRDTEVDWKKIAAYNKLKAPYALKEGQILFISPVLSK
jgi:LysM repeat protein